MNTRQAKTLEAVFARPTRSDIAWTAIESLFLSLGAEVSEGAGSRLRVELNGVRAVYHCPHPKRTASKDAVEAIRDHLVAAGVRP